MNERVLQSHWTFISLWAQVKSLLRCLRKFAFKDFTIGLAFTYMRFKCGNFHGILHGCKNTSSTISEVSG